MLLKKQTVWLLTMLSLVVVLSVYYITSPEPGKTDLAGIEEKQDEQPNAGAETNNSDTTTEAKDGKTVISGVDSDEVFEALRMELADQRSKLKTDLQEMIASAKLPAKEKSEAFDQMKELDELATKESMLETLIKGTMDYEDVLVRADGQKVRITVKAKDHDAAAANEIIRMVRTELGSLQAVAVEFQPKK
ncbi:SpoIIIAH-like family protein [Bacillus sp. T33-2]|uniref:SpoIIIAH-like family protein n=1 Tax=Bacillus sp. T33-2 TaxID=2054168 RepID=UPI000C767245|nr:SpoIIIAH-like family protein [Bacillus sp. T33-2]PLR99883.1 stage III sporulation protein AH [Bacillus sp. T33-2]